MSSEDTGHGEEIKKRIQLSTAKGTSIERMSNSIGKLLTPNTDNLTVMQQRAFNAIEHARKTSHSAIAFMDKLAAINNRVDELVPEGERELLHRMISITYHGLKEVNDLIARGYLSGTAERRPQTPKPNGKIKLVSDLTLRALMQTAVAQTETIVLPEIVIMASGASSGISYSDWYYLQSYSNSGSSNYEDTWWNDSGSALAQVWTIALIEPTPIGETVATILTVGILGYYAITRADCIDEYVRCGGGWQCSDCLHYCIVQGNWNCY